jgi:hypothetical protein
MDIATLSDRHGYGNDVELSRDRDVAETILRKRFPFGEVASLKPCRGGGISTVYEVLCSGAGVLDSGRAEGKKA